MRPVLFRCLLMAGAVPALASAAHAREVKPPAKDAGPHTMVIQNGSRVTYHYFAGQGSAADTATLRELERAENEQSYLDSLQALRRQYIDSERSLAVHRAAVQSRLYGVTSEYGTGFTFNGNNAYGGTYGLYGGFGGYRYPYVFSYGGYNNWPGESYWLSNSSRVTYGLPASVGDEGRLKDALVQTIARQSSPEYAAAVNRSYHAALARAGESERLRGLVGLAKDRAPAAEKPVKGTLLLKSGDKIEGTLLREDADWYVVGTPTDEISVRKSDVTRITRPKAKAE